MLLNTRHFGEIEVDEEGIIQFSDGIPGFEEVKKYILLGNEQNEEGNIFKWLQAIEEPELAFVIVNPFLIRKDYDIEISDDICKRLGIKAISDIEPYSIVVVPGDISQMTVNLKAPIIINVKEKKGAQVVLDSAVYGVRHYVLEELRRQEDSNHAGSDKEKRSVYRHR